MSSLNTWHIYSPGMVHGETAMTEKSQYYPVEARPFEPTVGPPIYFPREEPDAMGTWPAFQMMGPAEVQHQKSLILDEKRWFAPDEGEVFGDYVARYHQLIERWAASVYRAPSRAEIGSVVEQHPF